MSKSIEYISQALKAQRVGHLSAQIDWLLTDSRSLAFPENTLFFAIQTSRGDGHNYLASLYRNGVRNFVVTYIPEELDEVQDANFLIVPQTLRALQLLACQHRASFQIPVLGITGSNGKTVVKEWLYQLLRTNYSIVRSPRSYNSQIGVPLSVWLMNDQSQLGIFEAGISEKGEMDALQQIIRPTIGVITNIGGAHQENFVSKAEKCEEKMRLFRESEVIIYDADNTLVSECVAHTLLGIPKIGWSRFNPESPLYIEQIKKGTHHTCIHYHYSGISGSFQIPFIDEASIENSLHCLAVALYLRVPMEQISLGMANLEQVAMRLEVKEGKNGCLLINDSYSADLASLDIALDFMARRAQEGTYKRTIILSDLLETGQSSKLLYRQVADLLQSRGVQKLIGVGPNICGEANRFLQEKYFFQTTEDLLYSDVFASLSNEAVLIKGARSYRFDKLADALEQKVHETILEVDLNALVANYNQYRNMIKPETKMVCMVKASAYGAGSYEVARTLQDHRVDYLAVAVADEGFDLRKAGVTCPIMIMNPELSAFKTMFDNKLEPEVYSFALLRALIHAASREGITNYPIHIKINTGMNRLGFEPQEMPKLITMLREQTAVIPRSVFSHLVGSDSSQFDTFTAHQITTFKAAADALQEAFSHKILYHICNTAGIARFPEAQFDMVRLGLGLYGVDPYNNQMLHNVSTLKTTILQIHQVDESSTIGYSRKGVLRKNSRIAAIPIGYADGLNRRLGNRRGYCLVNGKQASYVGNICMDVCMIDVTDIDCKEGDEVIIFGKHLPPTVLAEQLDTIPYEILTSVSTRVKRIYYQD